MFAVLGYHPEPHLPVPIPKRSRLQAKGWPIFSDLLTAQQEKWKMLGCVETRIREVVEKLGLDLLRNISLAVSQIGDELGLCPA